MTPLQEFKQQAQAAGGDAWTYELLIRAGKDGIRGAHVLLAWEAPGVGGAKVGGVSGAYPVTVAADDPFFDAVCGSLNTTAIAQVADLEQQVADLTTERDALQQQVTSLQQQLAALQTPSQD